MKSRQELHETFNWDQYEMVPFAVLIFSSVVGWIECHRPASAAEAWKAYEAIDSRNKMLLNYGAIMAEEDERKRK